MLAEVKLAGLDLYEDLARLWEQERIVNLRESHARFYRRLLGIDPAKRHVFREGLRNIQGGGGMSVVHLTELMNRD